MTRKKVKLAWIVNDYARKTSLKKRRVGLLKKVSELATLCGVDTFVIVYSPNDNEPIMWPARPMVEELVARFQGVPDMERSKKLMNLDTYLKQTVAKDHEKHKKLNMKNLEVKMDHLMSRINKGQTLHEFQISELHSLVQFVEEKMKEVSKRVDYFQHVPLPPRSLPPQSPLPGDNIGRIGSSGGGVNTTRDAMINQWLTDLVNNSKNVASSSSVRSDIGLPYSNTYVGSSSVANDMGQLPHDGIFRGHTGGSDMRLLPHGNVGGSGSGNIMGPELDMQPQGNIKGSSSADVTGLGQQPHGTGGVTIGGNEMRLPFEIFGGNSGGGDIGLPFDFTKTNFPSNFSP